MRLGSTRRSHPGQTIGPGLGGRGVVDVIAAATGAGLVAGVVVWRSPRAHNNSNASDEDKSDSTKNAFLHENSDHLGNLRDSRSPATTGDISGSLASYLVMLNQ